MKSTAEQSDNGQGKQVTDEEILNVFRRSDKPYLKTGDVVKELSIGERAVQKRLNRLEDDGRLVSESVGPAIVRWLDDDEPTEVVNEGEVKYHRWSKKVENFGSGAIAIGFWGFAIAGFLMLGAIATSVSSVDFLPESPDIIFLLVLIFVYIASGAILLWGASKCLRIILTSIADRYGQINAALGRDVF